MNQRDRQAQATKRKLLEAAEKLITQYGYDHVTVDQIVADCGVAKGTFYHYFKSKEEILAEICHILYETLEEQSSALDHLSTLEKISWFISNWHQQMSTYNLHLARQTIQLYTTAPADAGQYGEKISQMEKGISMLQNFLTEAVRQGQLSADTPVTTLAKALMFTMQGSTVYHCKHEEDFDVMAWNQEFLQHILNPLLAPYLTKTTP